jgi:hypothetical protein
LKKIIKFPEETVIEYACENLEGWRRLIQEKVTGYRKEVRK